MGLELILLMPSKFRNFFGDFLCPLADLNVVRLVVDVQNDNSEHHTHGGETQQQREVHGQVGDL